MPIQSSFSVSRKTKSRPHTSLLTHEACNHSCPLSCLCVNPFSCTRTIVLAGARARAHTHTHTHTHTTLLDQQQGACLGGVAFLLASVFACLYFKSMAQKQEDRSIDESDLESDDDWSVDADFVYGKTLPMTSLPVCILNFTITCTARLQG
jgi:hypothetical protein